jgi:hypothetical protein
MKKVTFRLSLAAALCAVGLFAAAPASAATYDFNAGGGGFSVTNFNDPFDGPWVYGATSGVGGSGGWSTDGQGPELGRAPSTYLTSPAIPITAAGEVQLSFDHRYSFEVGAWDGGALFVSRNGGAFSKVSGGSFTANGYNGIVLPGSNSELQGTEAFIETSAGYGEGHFLTSTANLGSYIAGDSLQIRFTAAYDTNTTQGTPDWAIDNVLVRTPIPEPTSLLLLATAGAAIAVAARRKRRLVAA